MNACFTAVAMANPKLISYVASVASVVGVSHALKSKGNGFLHSGISRINEGIDETSKSNKRRDFIDVPHFDSP